MRAVNNLSDFDVCVPLGEHLKYFVSVFALLVLWVRAFSDKGLPACPRHGLGTFPEL